MPFLVEEQGKAQARLFRSSADLSGCSAVQNANQVDDLEDAAFQQKQDPAGTRPNMSPSHRRAECLYIEVFTQPSETRSPSIGEWIRFEWPIREETVPQSCWWPTIAVQANDGGPDEISGYPIATVL
jgi:hypothetical protein